MIRLYHLSLNQNLTTLIPRVPKNQSVKAGLEDGVNKRVCFGQSIKGALSAVPHGEIGDIMYIYMPTAVDKRFVYYPTPQQVPWVSVTHEVWYTAPVSVKKVGALVIGNETFKKLLHHPVHPELTAPTYTANYKRFKGVPTEEERQAYLKTQNQYAEYMEGRQKGYRRGLVKGLVKGTLGALAGLAIFVLVGSQIKRVR